MLLTVVIIIPKTQSTQLAAGSLGKGTGAREWQVTLRFAFYPLHSVLFSKACGHAVLIQSSFTQGTQKDLLLVLVFITSLQGELTSDFGRD